MSGDETPPETRSEVADRLGVGLGDAILGSVVAAFWQPTQSQPAMLMVPGPNGGAPDQIVVPQFHGPSPFERAVRAIYAQHGDTIVERVASALDLDALAEKIAGLAVDKLTERRDSWHYSRHGSVPSADEIEKLVREKIAEKLSARAVDEYDKRQAAMYEAWQREQERQRATPGVTPGSDG